MATTKVLGLDIALAQSGWAVLSYADGELIDCGTIKTTAKQGLPERIAAIRDAVSGILTNACGSDFDVDVAIEDGIALRSGTATRRLAMAWGAAVVAVWDSQRIEPHIVKPTEVKQLATGKGNAKKPEMVAAAQARWDNRITNDDMADAAWVAEHARLHMHNLFPDGDGTA